MADAHYAKLLRTLLEQGTRVQTRNATVRRLFHWSCHFARTPLVSLRKTAWKNALREWQWFMSGSNRLEDLHPDVRPWWQPWATGSAFQSRFVPFNYAKQFREFYGSEGMEFDQIAYLIAGIRDHPYSRRNVITTWNTADMASKFCWISNCHGTVIQAFVQPDNSLHLVTYQRSSDVMVGLGANWLQYWAFLMWLAHRTGRLVGSLTWIGGDVHLYDEHEDLARRVLGGEPKPSPTLVYEPSSEDFMADDFSLDVAYMPTNRETARMVV